jgi:DNA-binding MarR family transcriptional regulator
LPRRTNQRPLAALELDAWRGLLRTHARLVRELDREMMLSEGIGLTAYDVLLSLAQAPGRRLRMKQIAESMLLSRSGLTGIISDLERRGYVTRQTVSDDRRGIDAVLTTAGHAALRHAHRVHLAGVRERFLRHLTDEQLRHLADAWSSIDAGAADGAEPCPMQAAGEP